MTAYHFLDESKLVDPLEPAEPEPMDTELAEKARQRKQQEEDERLTAMIKQAAAVIAGDRLDVATTVEGALTTVLAANVAGNHAQWIIAMKCFSDVLTAVTERENRLLTMALARREEERQQHERRQPLVYFTMNRP